jgi:hypothetical protein
VALNFLKSKIIYRPQTQINLHKSDAVGWKLVQIFKMENYPINLRAKWSFVKSIPGVELRQVVRREVLERGVVHVGEDAGRRVVAEGGALGEHGQDVGAAPGERVARLVEKRVWKDEFRN